VLQVGNTIRTRDQPERAAKSLRFFKKWFEISPIRVTSPVSGKFKLESGFLFC